MHQQFQSSHPTLLFTKNFTRFNNQKVCKNAKFKCKTPRLNVKHIKLGPGKKHLIQFQPRGPLTRRFDEGHELKVWHFCTIISTNFGVGSRVEHRTVAHMFTFSSLSSSPIPPMLLFVKPSFLPVFAVLLVERCRNGLALGKSFGLAGQVAGS